IAGQDCHSVDLVALPVPPALVNPGKGNQMRLTRTKLERAPLALLARPFVEAVGRNQATAPALALRNDAFTRTYSDRAVISVGNCFGSFTKEGSKPQCMSLKRRVPFRSRATTAIG